MRKPYLEFWFDCGIIEVVTRIERECLYQDVIDHIELSLKFFRKYGFKFRLYSPYIWRGQQDEIKERKMKKKNMKQNRFKNVVKRIFRREKIDSDCTKS